MKTHANNYLKRRRLPDRIADAMNTILDYLWQQEARDWLARGEAEQEGHVFGEMLIVRQWLKDGRSTMSRRLRRS